MSESPGGCKDPWRCILVFDSGLSYLHVSLLVPSSCHKLFRTASKVPFTVICKGTLSLAEFLGFLPFMGWPMASLLRKQVTSKQEGETLRRKT